MNKPRAAYEMYCIVRGDGQIINTMHYRSAADDLAKDFREAGGEYHVYPCIVIVTGTEWKPDADHIQLNGSPIVMPKRKYLRDDARRKPHPVHDMIKAAIQANPGKSARELAIITERSVTQVYMAARDLKVKLPRKYIHK